MNGYNKTETNLQREQTGGYPWGDRRDGGQNGYRVRRYTLLCIRQKVHKDTFTAEGNSHYL